MNSISRINNLNTFNFLLKNSNNNTVKPPRNRISEEQKPPKQRIFPASLI